MKRISKILLIIGCLFMISSCSKYTSAEQEVLKEYEKLTTADYNLKYDYLDDENNVFVSASFEEVIKKLKKDTFILYVGGSWCPNCQASAKFINIVAKELDIEEVYNFDTRISGLKTAEKDIRNCNDEAQTSLYRTLIEALNYVNPSGTVTEGTDIARLAVPAVFAVKNGKVEAVVVREYFYDEEKDLLYLYGDETNYKDEYIKELKELMLLIK